MNLKWLLKTSLTILKNFLYDHCSKVNFSVTYKCNQLCQTCNIWNIYKKNPELKKQEFSLKEFNIFFKKNPHLIWVSLTGGEPFLREDISDIICSAIENIRNLRVISITTNGSMPEKIENDIYKILNFTENPPFLFISISLNGPQSVHNALSRVSDSYQRALETFRRLDKINKKYNKLKVGFEYTFSRFNSGRLRDTLRSLAKEDIVISLDKWTFPVAQESCYYNLSSQTRLSPNLDMLNQELNWIFKKYPKKFFENPFSLISYTYLKLAFRYANTKNRFPCAAITHSCFIDPYGMVYPCIFMLKKLGDLRTNDFSLKKILRSKKTERTKELLKRNCQGCWTPCEAYQSIVFKPSLFFKSLMKSKHEKRRDRQAK